MCIIQTTNGHGIVGHAHFVVCVLTQFNIDYYLYLYNIYANENKVAVKNDLLLIEMSSSFAIG